MSCKSGNQCKNCKLKALEKLKHQSQSPCSSKEEQSTSEKEALKTSVADVKEEETKLKESANNKLLISD